VPQVVGNPAGGVTGIQLSSKVKIFSGPGSPVNSTVTDVINASVGSLYLRNDGGDGTTLYVLIGAGVGWTSIA